VDFGSNFLIYEAKEESGYVVEMKNVSLVVHCWGYYSPLHFVVTVCLVLGVVGKHTRFVSVSKKIVLFCCLFFVCLFESLQIMLTSRPMFLAAL
jgi:hypothetical protein